MKYLIIGLGNYGGVLAEELTALGQRNFRRNDIKIRWLQHTFLTQRTRWHCLSFLLTV